MKKTFIVLLALTTFSAFAEDKTMCGYYTHDEESFTGPERTTLDVRGRGIINLIFMGRTPYYSDGAYYCCFGDYSDYRKELLVRTGCTEKQATN